MIRGKGEEEGRGRGWGGPSPFTRSPFSVFPASGSFRGYGTRIPGGPWGAEHNLKGISVAIPRNRLTVITGLSGSGKSSLAFDTIYAEGQRRYVESLSAYARQFLGLMEKPDVDAIEGLSPAISIEQKTTGQNPRSTVGTVTEIYDYLRLLWARAGIPHCPNDGTPVTRQSASQITDTILSWPAETRIEVLAPIVRGRKESFVISSTTSASGASFASGWTARPTISAAFPRSIDGRTTTSRSW